MIVINKSFASHIGLHAEILHAYLLSIASAKNEVTGDIDTWHKELDFLERAQVNAALWKLGKVGLIQKIGEGRYLINE